MLTLERKACMMNDIEKHIGHLISAELQFRLASAVRLAVTMGKQPLDLPMDWSHGEQKVRYEEIALRKDQADFAVWNMHRSATYLMAVTIKDAIKAAVENPKKSRDSNVQAAYQISRLIRNAFAHSPFAPKWSIDPDCRNHIFKVCDIVTLDTSGLHGTLFDWRQYGGPLAMLRLCQYVRFEVLKDERRPRKVVPKQTDVYFQQGNLILKQINKEIEKK